MGSSICAPSTSQDPDCIPSYSLCLNYVLLGSPYGILFDPNLKFVRGMISIPRRGTEKQQWTTNFFILLDLIVNQLLVWHPYFSIFLQIHSSPIQYLYSNFGKFIRLSK